MLAILSILLCLSFTPNVNEEKEAVYSVYFDKKCQPGTKLLSAVNSRFFGNYELMSPSENDLRSTAGDRLTIDASGIYIEKNKLLSISRTEIRENPQYAIREGFLHGVVDNDSVMVALEDENYYFLLPKKTYLFDKALSSSTLHQGLSSNDYLVLSSEETGYLSALYVSFTAGNIALKELNFDQKELDFRSVTHKEISGKSHPTYLLNPTKKEWQSIMQHFVTYDNYSKMVGK